MATSSPERITARIEWGPGEGIRAGARIRIRKSMEKVLQLCQLHDLSIADVAKTPGAPSLRCLRYWLSQDLYSFKTRYKKIRLDQFTQRWLDGTEELRRQEAADRGPRVLARYDLAQSMIFLKAFRDAEEDTEPSTFTVQERGILDLCGQGWSLRRIGRYCDLFNAMGET
jgi:hypothetical protein